MSESMWGYLFVILGIAAMALLILFGTLNYKNESNYYSLKEITQDAMLDSVDQTAYKVGLTDKEVQNVDTIDCVSNKPGTIRIVTEKFVENFARRYANTAVIGPNYNYKIEFYEIQECPAKVSLKVTSTEKISWIKRLFTGGASGGETAVVENELSSILETKD